MLFLQFSLFFTKKLYSDENIHREEEVLARKPLRKVPLPDIETPSEPAPKATGEPEFRVLSDTGRVQTVEMTVDAWITLAPHPHQRNTVRHSRAVHLKQAKRANGAVADHLAHVVAACWEGNYYKVDGHTRGYLWEKGELPRPDRLHATIYRVASRTELEALYETFDAPAAAKTRYDQIYAAYRECGFQPQSNRLRHGFLNDALNIALRGAVRSQQERGRPEVNLYRAVAVFKPELELLDGLDPQPQPFYSGVVAAALIGLALFPADRVLEFFEKLKRGEGNRKEGRSDPVDAVLTVINQMSLERTRIRAARQVELCARTLRGLLTWLAGPNKQRNQYWLQYGIKAVDMAPLQEQMKVKKGIRDDPML